MASICSSASERFIGGSFLDDGVYSAPQSGECQERSGVRQCFALPLLLLSLSEGETKAVEQSTTALQSAPCRPPPRCAIIQWHAEVRSLRPEEPVAPPRPRPADRQ